jgi:chemotaxis protein histidine kinase CheA
MISKIEAWGCNVQEALERFVDDADLYIMCMNLFVGDASFASLGEAIKSQNYEAAFEAAHTLKGVAGNVSAGPLYEIIESLTDKLRANNHAGVEEDYKKIMGYRDSLAAVLAG